MSELPSDPHQARLQVEGVVALFLRRERSAKSATELAWLRVGLLQLRAWEGQRPEAFTRATRLRLRGAVEARPALLGEEWPELARAPLPA